MKRFLSVTLCVMMIASLFAVNVSAAIPLKNDISSTTAITTLQTYDDITSNKLFTTGQYNLGNRPEVFGKAESATNSNKVTELSFSVKSKDALVWEEVTDAKGETYQKPTNLNYFNAQVTEGKSSKNFISDNTVIPVKYVFQFDVCAENNAAGLVFTRRGLCDNGSLDPQVGIVIPPDTMIEGKWYTYRFVVDETDYRAQTNASTARSKFKAGLKVYRADRGSSEFAPQDLYNWKVNANGNGAIGFQINCNNPNSGASKELASDVDITDVSTYSYYAKADASSKTTTTFYNDALATTYLLDNIALYPYPEYENFDINNGFVFEYLTETNLPAETGTKYSNKAIGWASEPESIVATFDAMIDKGDGPLTFSVSGYNHTAATATIAPTTFGKWYNYKIVYDNSGAVANAVEAIYRKESGTNTWSLLAQAPDAIDIAGYDWWVGYNSSPGAGQVKWFAYNNQGGAGTSNATIPTSWNVRNIQITDGNVIKGDATVADGNLTVALNTELYSAADVIVAVYDGTKLANVSYAPVAITGNAATVTVPYVAGNTVKVYAWDSLATGVPVLAAPITVTVAQ